MVSSPLGVAVIVEAGLEALLMVPNAPIVIGPDLCGIVREREFAVKRVVAHDKQQEERVRNWLIARDHPSDDQVDVIRKVPAKCLAISSK